MFRAVASLVGLVSFAAVLAQGIAAAVLVARGQLNSSAVTSIGEVLSGRALVTVVEAPSEAHTTITAAPPSADEVDAERTIRTLELNARADDLRLLKELLTAEADQLAKDRAAYEQARTSFEQRLAEVRARATEEATDQARLVVKSLPPREAVLYLISLDEADALRIVSGLPERTTAKILQEFAGGTDEERQRGESLFEAISAGAPEAELTDTARNAMPKPPADRAGG
jgi:flagellar motility protein MotE (MotC chaperone)